MEQRPLKTLRKGENRAASRHIYLYVHIYPLGRRAKQGIAKGPSTSGKRVLAAEESCVHLQSYQIFRFLFLSIFPQAQILLFCLFNRIWL